MQAGAYREAFEGTAVPDWAARAGFNVLSNDFPAMTGLPARSNVWFDTNSKVLQLETDGEVVSNTLAYADATAVSFNGKPVYVDLRMKFDPLVNAPDPDLLASSKMALFLTADAKLVVVHGGGATTNAAALDTNKWYQVTVKLQDNKFDVLLNDAPVFTDLAVRNAGAANTLASANFYGTGMIDNLYVSHGDPAYAVPGPTQAVPTLPAPTSLSDEELTRVNAWLSDGNVTEQSGLSGLGQTQINQAYLLNSINAGAGTVTKVDSYNFGISKIEMTSPTDLDLTLALKVNNVDKEGDINGRVQIYGKTEINGTWTLLEGAITPMFAHFVNGSATYNYKIPNPQLGMVIYEEDFEGIETDNTADSLTAIGWTLSEQFKSNTARYSISNGKLYVDNLDRDGAASSDSYALIKSSDFMRTYCTNDYTYQYDVTYRAASGDSAKDSGTRYVSLLCNYTGTNVYNTVDLRYGGNGYNQARLGESAWPHYDDSGALNATGADSMLYKLFGEFYVSGNVTTNALKDRTCTVRVEMSMANGPTVYVNGLKVSEMTKNQANWTATKDAAYAICFKPSRDIKAEIDNIKIWTGCGVEPGGYRYFKPAIVP